MVLKYTATITICYTLWVLWWSRVFRAFKVWDLSLILDACMYLAIMRITIFHDQSGIVAMLLDSRNEVSNSMCFVLLRALVSQLVRSILLFFCFLSLFGASYDCNFRLSSMNQPFHLECPTTCVILKLRLTHLDSKYSFSRLLLRLRVGTSSISGFALFL
jgi:hypothetical protein